MYLIETCVNSPSNRGKYIPLDEMVAWLNKYKGKQLYTGYFAHPKRDKNSHKAFRIAFDYEDPEIHHTDRDQSCRNVLPLVREHYDHIKDTLKVEPWIWYTGGGGFHLEFQNVFNADSTPILPNMLKYNIVTQLFNGEIPKYLDLAPIMRRGTFRAPYSLHSTTKRYKIPVPVQLLTEKGFEEIKQLSEQLPIHYSLPPYTEWLEKGGDLDMLIPTPEEARLIIPTEGEAWTIQQPSTCIQKMLSKPPVPGKRHQQVLVLASMMVWSGFGYYGAMREIMFWLQPTIKNHQEAQGFMATIKDVYFKKSYQFSCKHDFVQASGACIQYARCPFHGMREYNIKTSTLQEAANQLVKKKQWKEEGKFLDMRSVFNLDSPYLIFPEETCVFAGDTGMNKSTLVDNLMVANGQHSFLKFNNELTSWLQSQRLFQIALGYTELQAENNAEAIAAGRKIEELSHIEYTDDADIKTTAELISFINRKNPFVVIVDVIEGVNVGQDDMNKRIREVVLALSQNAKTYGRIAILVHHVRKPQVKLNHKGAAMYQKELTLSDLAWDRSVVTKTQHVFVIEPTDEPHIRRVRTLKSSNNHPLDTQVWINFNTMQIRSG